MYIAHQACPFWFENFFFFCILDTFSTHPNQNMAARVVIANQAVFDSKCAKIIADGISRLQVSSASKYPLTCFPTKNKNFENSTGDC
jgi:hypothetical protein